MITRINCLLGGAIIYYLDDYSICYTFVKSSDGLSFVGLSTSHLAWDKEILTSWRYTMQNSWNWVWRRFRMSLELL